MSARCSKCDRITREPFETRPPCVCGSVCWYQGERLSLMTLLRSMEVDITFEAEAPYPARARKLGYTNRLAYQDRSRRGTRERGGSLS